MHRCYEFIDHYNFDREVVGVAIYYFDRYTSSQTSCEGVHTKDKFQIIAVTSLFLAIKLHSMSEDHLVQSRPHALARLLYGHVDPQEIYEMEMAILEDHISRRLPCSKMICLIDGPFQRWHFSNQVTK